MKTVSRFIVSVFPEFAHFNGFVDAAKALSSCITGLPIVALVMCASFLLVGVPSGLVVIAVGRSTAFSPVLVLVAALVMFAVVLLTMGFVFRRPIRLELHRTLMKRGLFVCYHCKLVSHHVYGRQCPSCLKIAPLTAQGGRKQRIGLILGFLWCFYAVTAITTRVVYTNEASLPQLLWLMAWSAIGLSCLLRMAEQDLGLDVADE